MGDKYIIELEEKPFHDDNGDFLYRVKGFNSLVFDMTGIGKLTPYTEPDLEQVMEEAYEHGYKKCLSEHDFDSPCVSCDEYKRGLADAKCGYENGFENGMIVAWDAAKKIALMDTETSENVTGYFGLFRIMENLTPMQAIEKIRQYEQEQENEFKVGDEFENESGKKFVVLKMNGKEIDRYIDVDGKTYCMTVKYKEMRKTGRHFPEIATVLKKMRGEQDG